MWAEPVRPLGPAIYHIGVSGASCYEAAKQQAREKANSRTAWAPLRRARRARESRPPAEAQSKAASILRATGP